MPRHITNQIRPAGGKTTVSISFWNEVLAHIDGIALAHDNTRSAQLQLMAMQGTIYEPWVAQMIANEKKRRNGGG